MNTTPLLDRSFLLICLTDFNDWAREVVSTDDIGTASLPTNGSPTNTPKYDTLGLGDRTDIEFFDGLHEINGKGTFEFLHKHLKWPKPSTP